MMQKEFEKLAGYEVTCDDYRDYIEPMYMALPDSVTKQDFVRMIDKKRFALPTRQAMVKEMKKIAKFLFENCGLRSYYEEKQKLDKLAKAYAKRFYGLDWTNDIKAYAYFNTNYAYCGCLMDRGCSFPYELVIGRANCDYARIQLVKF